MLNKKRNNKHEKALLLLIKKYKSAKKGLEAIEDLKSCDIARNTLDYLKLLDTNPDA
tara:strand:+ start:296 stop:466 length:171 start_codon:yes stop_codon:yes gene_type:complete